MKTLYVIFFVRGKQVRRDMFSNVQHDAPTIAIFCVVYQIKISLLTKIFQVQITSYPFLFKRRLSVLNMILETLTSFDSVFRDIARPAINFATDFDFSPIMYYEMLWFISHRRFLIFVHCIFAPGKLRAYTLKFFIFSGISQPLRCFTMLPTNYDN